MTKALNTFIVKKNRSATNDIIFKYTLKRCREIIKKIIEHVTDIKVTKMEFLDTHFENNLFRKYQICDLVLNINDKYIVNIEMDNTPTEGKRVVYCGDLLAFQLKSGTTYESLKPVIQIVFDNYHHFENTDEYNKICFQNEHKQIDNEYIKKSRICLPNVCLECYNKEELSEFEKICLILQCDDEEQRLEIAGESEVLRKMAETITNATKETDLMGLIKQYDYNEFQRTFDKYESRKAGLAEGEVRGRSKGIAETAKKMKTNGIAIDLISKITNLDVKYIATL